METLKLHIENENLELKDFIKILNVVNKSINEVKEEQGIESNQLNNCENATIIKSVEKGSIIIDIACGFLVELIPQIIKHIIKKVNEKKSKIEVGASNNKNEINIYINNSKINIELDDRLNSMGTSWFVSYCYYNNIDKNHKNWGLVDNKNRISTYNSTKQYHRYFLTKILDKSDSMKRNEINLTADEIKKMSQELLKISDI